MGSKDRMKLRLKRAARHMRPSHIISSRITKKVFSDFADKAGLVYFGSVDQRDDDHRLIRGHTVSQTHTDSNYCIGTVDGYDVMLTLRNDVIKGRNGKEYRCHWLIVAVDLHAKQQTPHFYLGHRDRDVMFMAAFKQIYPLAVGILAPYASKFLNDYTFYGKSTDTIDIERLITPISAQVIAEHFQQASIELDDNMVYLYTENNHPTEEDLDKILSNAIWLAKNIDDSIKKE